MKAEEFAYCATCGEPIMRLPDAPLWQHVVRPVFSDFHRPEPEMIEPDE